MQMLAQGDVIVGGNGHRWQVGAIKTYNYQGHVWHLSYVLIGLFGSLPQMSLTRKELCEMFGGLDTKNGYWRR